MISFHLRQLYLASDKKAYIRRLTLPEVQALRNEIDDLIQAKTGTQEGFEDFRGDFTHVIHITYTRDSIDEDLDRALIDLLTGPRFCFKLEGRFFEGVRRDIHFSKTDFKVAGTA